MKTKLASIIFEGLLALLFLGACALFGFLAYHADDAKELVMYAVVYAGCLCYGAGYARSFAELLLKRNHCDQKEDKQ